MGIAPPDNICPMCQREIGSEDTHIIQTQMMEVVRGEDSGQWEHLLRHKEDIPPASIKMCMPCVEKSFLFWLDNQEIQPGWAKEVRKEASKRLRR